MIFNVFNGEYPFDKELGTVEAEDEVQALQKALEKYSTPEDRHVVVEPKVTVQ